MDGCCDCFEVLDRRLIIGLISDVSMLHRSISHNGPARCTIVCTGVSSLPYDSQPCGYILNPIGRQPSTCGWFVAVFNKAVPRIDTVRRGNMEDNKAASGILTYTQVFKDKAAET